MYLLIEIILVILSIAACLLALPTIIFITEVLSAILKPGHRPKVSAPLSTSCTSVAALIPAHNEGASLKPTIEDLRPQLRACDRLIVIADNCTDDTAEMARAAGAEVLERHDPDRRGKGYALDFGLKNLSGEPPEVVIVIDADCRVAPDAIDQLARACVGACRPVQALDLMLPAADSIADHRIATFAWRVKNWVRPLGLQVLGLPCQLMGTGMAFPWAVIRDANLATGHIVEDLKLGLDLAGAGHAPVFCPSAMVTSEFPSSVASTKAQRQRWEGGHLAMVVKVAIPQVCAAVLRLNRDLLALALDMAVPPLTFLAFSSVGVFVLTGLGFLAGLSAIPLVISATSLATFFIAVLLCWFKFGRDLLSLGELDGFGPFVLGKIRLYRDVLSGRTSSQWTRADRASDLRAKQ